MTGCISTKCTWRTISVLTQEMFGKIFAGKGYISRPLFEKLLERDITLVTKIKKNMKERRMDAGDKLLLRKRAIIESVNDFLKNICRVHFFEMHGLNIRAIVPLSIF